MDVQAVFDPINYKIKERLLNSISIMLFAIKKHSFISPYFTDVVALKGYACLEQNAKI